MLTVDLNVKIESIDVKPLSEGASIVMHLSDATSSETRLDLRFYKKQVDYIMKKLNEVDYAKIRNEIREQFVLREGTVREQIREEFNTRLEFEMKEARMQFKKELADARKANK